MAPGEHLGAAFMHRHVIRLLRLLAKLAKMMLLLMLYNININGY